MAQLIFHVENQYIHRLDEFHVVARSNHYLYAEFTFSDDWVGVKTALFSVEADNGETITKPMLIGADGTCEVPHEVLEYDNSQLEVSAFCGNRVTANVAVVPVHESGYNNDSAPDDPTPDVYTQILNRLANVEQIVVDKATEAESWAVGGTETREDEDIDNSKYYAEQAGISATAAAESATNALESAENASDSASSAHADAGIASQKSAEAIEAKESVDSSLVEMRDIETNVGTLADNAAASAEESSNAMSAAMGYSETAAANARTATVAAEDAASAASYVSGSVSRAAGYATNAQNYASAAERSMQSAATSERNAAQSSTNAATYASNAEESATNSALSASDSNEYAGAALQSENEAKAAQTAAESARDDAVAAKNVAEAKAQDIQSSAQQIATNTQNIATNTADIAQNTSDIADVKEDLTLLDDHVRYENENIIAENDIQITSGVTINSANSSFAVSIDNGASFRFRVNGTNLINQYALYYVGSTSGRFATNLSPNTNYEFTAPVAITGLYIYVGAADVIGSGTLKLVAANVTFNNESIDKKVVDLEVESDAMSALRGDKWQLDKSSFTTICVHHDNFSRTMTGYEIGMNAGGTDEGNSYDWVTQSSYDDGLRVDNGATFESGSRTYSYSLRKIAEPVSDNFIIETNTPIIDFPVMFGFKVEDINNFMAFEIRKNNAGYRIIIYPVVNGAFQSGSAILDKTCSGLGKVLSIYCIRGIAYIYIDDTFLCSVFVGELGNYVYLASLRSYNTHFDFINVFNAVSKTAWNPNRILDSGISDIPLKTISANEGNYELQNTITRWSNYADHMTLHSDDQLIHNGRRCEISVGNMNDHKGNLRHFVISFDVLFPSEYIDTEQGDLFVQTHDRDGTYRGTVPFALYIKNNVINVNISSTYQPKADSTAVIIDLHRVDFAEVELGKWHHFEIEIKERYEERQNPFLSIRIDGNTEFECRKANCYNDLLGTSPQYGIYKNNWGTGVTEFQRYFDNFKIEYC